MHLTTGGRNPGGALFFPHWDDGLGAQVRQHRLCSFLGEPYVVHLKFGEILTVGAGDDRCDTVQVDRLV